MNHHQFSTKLDSQKIYLNEKFKPVQLDKEKKNTVLKSLYDYTDNLTSNGSRVKMSLKFHKNNSKSTDNIILPNINKKDNIIMNASNQDG